MDAGGLCQWFIGNGTHQEENKHPSKPHHLHFSDALHCRMPMRHVVMLTIVQCSCITCEAVLCCAVLCCAVLRFVLQKQSSAICCLVSALSHAPQRVASSGTVHQRAQKPFQKHHHNKRPLMQRPDRHSSCPHMQRKPQGRLACILLLPIHALSTVKAAK